MELNDKIYLDIGSNHNGSYERAINIIREAGELKKTLSEMDNDIIAGVKFQVFKHDKLYAKDCGFDHYQEKLKEVETKIDWLVPLSKEARKFGLEFGISVFDEDTLDEISALEDFLCHSDVYLKVASSNLLLLDFISEISTLNSVRPVKVPLHISTGGSALLEIAEAVRTATMYGSDVIVYHCTMEYPCSIKNANISRLYSIAAEMKAVGVANPFEKIAYSDHTRNKLVALSALSIVGIMEIHFDASDCCGKENTCGGASHVWIANDIILLADMISTIDDCLYGDSLACPETIDHRADPSDDLRPMKHCRNKIVGGS